MQKRFVNFLLKRKYKFDYVLVSSSKRTSKNIENFVKKNYKPKKLISSKDLYLASENIIINTIKKIPMKYKSVLLINHEPSVKKFSTNLTKNQIRIILNNEIINSQLQHLQKFILILIIGVKLERNGLLKEFIRPKDLQDSKE